MASSSANDELNSFNPDFGYVGVFPISISDLSGRTVIQAGRGIKVTLKLLQERSRRI